MADITIDSERPRLLPPALAAMLRRRAIQLAGLALVAVAALGLTALISYSPSDPTRSFAAPGPVENLLGPPGAELADTLLRGFGLAGLLVPLLIGAWGWRVIVQRRLPRLWFRVALAPLGIVFCAATAASLTAPAAWPLGEGLGGIVGLVALTKLEAAAAGAGVGPTAVAWLFGTAGLALAAIATGITPGEWGRAARGTRAAARRSGSLLGRAAVGGVHVLSRLSRVRVEQGLRLRRRMSEWSAGEPAPGPTARPDGRHEPRLRRGPAVEASPAAPEPVTMPARASGGPASREAPQEPPRRAARGRQRTRTAAQQDLPFDGEYWLPPLDLLQLPAEAPDTGQHDRGTLEQNARQLESVLQDFGVKGEIVKVRPGPVVTLYELEPAPGTKSSRVIGLADDLARNMSAVSVRVATIPGRSVMGIELPNRRRQTVYLRELLESREYAKNAEGLPLALGKDIGGTPIVVNLERMPHLLIAGTTGSGKSVAINTMILSLLYRFTPDDCRLIMIDPKMLELSVYDDIPHLLAPVVTDPKKAIVALKWVVREMENRYRAMSTLGVRNIRGYNARVVEAQQKGEVLTRRVQTGFDPDTRKPVYEEQPLDMAPLPYIVVVVDEMADLMLVAGKDIEAAIQRLAQMARAAGIHLIMATQRPSVDVITGTIKANFPTRVSFQVTSKVDSRTILSEGGAEALLGQGDMLYMAGGGRISRVHGPFVDDAEVADVVGFLKRQGMPSYIESITDDDDVADGIPGFMDAEGGDGDDLYDRAVALVLRERKASTSFVQRHLQIGYNRAARLIERMESEGVVSPANHVGKRDILAGGDD